ncbi:MAG: hypothetical protein AAGE96_11080 [Cyanobacteria bacterium P01_G01_bin.19]
MTVEQVIATIRNNPQSWKVVFQSKESIVFAWEEYRFTRLSDRFDCVMILNSKYDRLNHIWQRDDPFIFPLYMGLVDRHLRGFATAS